MIQQATAYPTDYGPDRRTPLARALALPANKRPRLEELRQIARSAKPHKKRKEETGQTSSQSEETWQIVPETTPSRYICGGSALNTPDPLGRGGGDWHRTGTWRYMKAENERTRCAEVSTDRKYTPVMKHVLERVLGTERILDVREGLAKMGHPQANEEQPVWAASHERSTLEYVLESVLAHREPNAERYEYILDRRTAHRWLATEEQDEWVKRRLLEIAENLPERRALAIQRWVTNTFEEPKE